MRIFNFLIFTMYISFSLSAQSVESALPRAFRDKQHFVIAVAVFYWFFVLFYEIYHLL